MRAAQRPQFRLAGEPIERRVGQRRERIEGAVPPELDPDSSRMRGRTGAFRPALDQQFRQRLDARARAAVGFTEGEAIAIGVVDDAGLDDLGGRVDDAADRLARRKDVAIAGRPDRRFRRGGRAMGRRGRRNTSRARRSRRSPARCPAPSSARSRGAAAGSECAFSVTIDVVLHARLGRVGDAARMHRDAFAAADAASRRWPASPPDAARAR